MARVTFSHRSSKAEAIATHHRDLDAAVRAYYASPELAPAKFFGYALDELAAERQERLAELGATSSFMVLAALEAAFRIDYIQRCYQKLKDPVSRDFRSLFKKKAERVAFEDEILGVWKDRTTGSAALISDLRAAFKYRHWLAHGRYWRPKLGRAFDFPTIYELAIEAQRNFRLLGI